MFSYKEAKSPFFYFSGRARVFSARKEHMEETKAVGIETFRNAEFGEVRILEESGGYFFCGVDVAKALGYTNPRKAVRDHCKERTKRSALTPGGIQKVGFVPEGDVYRLIIHSKLPAAERFEHWVFDEVLPCIRKHGAYLTDSFLDRVKREPDLIYKMAEQMLSERQERKRLENELATAMPKAAYFDSFITPGDCTNIRTTAKELGVPEKAFIAYLVKHGFLYRAPAGNLLPYAKPKNSGLFIVRDFYYGRGQIGTYTLITPNGKAYFEKKVQLMLSAA